MGAMTQAGGGGLSFRNEPQQISLRFAGESYFGNKVQP